MKIENKLGDEKHKDIDYARLNLRRHFENNFSNRFKDDDGSFLDKILVSFILFAYFLFKPINLVIIGLVTIIILLL